MKRSDKKTLAIIIAVVSVVLLAGIVTAAAVVLRDTSGVVDEKLSQADVTCEVNSDYSVTNTGNVPALIRVKVIVNKIEGDEIIPGEVPSYTVSSDWTESGDYLYYNAIVSERDGEDVTSVPITFSETPADDIQVLVLAEAIQAASDAAGEGWGVTFSDGSWS